MVRNGLYKAAYEGHSGRGWGLAYLADGRIHGGDPLIYYVGTYTIHQNGTVTARVKASPYLDDQTKAATQLESLFGRDNNIVELAGDLTDDGGVTLVARSKNASGIALKIELSFLAE